MKKTAVILFNLGGPDSQSAVQPFLFNLFHDPAIIRLPQPFRFAIARLISGRRAPIAREIYAKMGGGSPILPNTEAQAQALEKTLHQTAADNQFKIFIAMRYWHPFTDEVVSAVKIFAPDEIILLPLYPQFSTTTSLSSLEEWHSQAKKTGLKVPTKTICCYPRQENFIVSLAAKIKPAYAEAAKQGKPRLLFSAHGLPEKIIAAGDPYQAQCEMTADALRAALNIADLDWVLCYQSRVGPLKWITPATDDEVRRAGKEKKPLVVVPIAFVSDHSETLVELDIEYRHLAGQAGVPSYHFVPAIGADALFIEGLAQIIRAAQNRNSNCASDGGARLCPATATACMMR